MDLGLPIAIGLRRAWTQQPARPNNRGFPLVLGRQNQAQKGPGRIAGVVQINGVTSGTPQRIRLYSRLTGQLIDQVWSMTNGTYEFLNVDTTPGREFEVVGIDGLRVYNAVIQDMVRP